MKRSMLLQLQGWLTYGILIALGIAAVLLLIFAAVLITRPDGF